MMNIYRFLGGLPELSTVGKVPRSGFPTYRVLVVESDARELETLSRELRRHGHAVEGANGGTRAFERYEDADLIVLDTELSDLDGLEVCRIIRQSSDIPIIVISESGTELDAVLGFQAGVDDYVVKPYASRELMARMSAVMRRMQKGQNGSSPSPISSHVVSHGQLKIDTKLREVSVGGRSVSVTPKEFDLLYLLASHADAIVPRREIMSQVWDGSWSSRTVDTHVSSLRSKLGSKGWILTIRGVGFRLGQVA